MSAVRTAIALVSTLIVTLLAAVVVAPSGPAVAAPGGASGAGDNTLDVLVLGDSYSAGNGATDDQGTPQTYGPTDCYRSTVNWSEKYAAALRASGQPVRLTNHACSGGVTADITSPRVMDTATNKVEQTPAGVTTAPQADASLAASDPCNTHTYPAEEFWTYHATNVNPLFVTYDCTRNLRPQADFVNSNVDLVLFTMGGNDAGFSSIVQNCFVPALRTAAGCKTQVDAARALLPTIQQRLVADVNAMRAHGLRNDAKLVQLGYPWLQVDDDFTLPGLPGAPSYDAGNQVRSLVTDGNAAIAATANLVNVGHPGQLTFLGGVPQKFSGHEPDASSLTGNPDRWVNQVGDGEGIVVWYHPNRLGQTAYAQLLWARGTFNAPTGPSSPAGPGRAGVRAKLHVRATPRHPHAGDRVRLSIKVKLSDGSRPRGRLKVRDAGTHRTLKAKVTRRDHGRVHLTLRVHGAGTTKLRFVYRDHSAPKVRVTRTLRTTR